jgi:hypothetical protein
VGGYFKSSLDKDLNNPPTAVGGIQSHNELGIESIRMNPPTAVGGIRSHNEFWIESIRMNPPTTVGGILKSFEQSPFVLLLAWNTFRQSCR